MRPIAREQLPGGNRPWKRGLVGRAEEALSRRPEPDGDTFILRDVQWNPTSTSRQACFQIP
jgi:hypothetical protein